MIDVFADPEIAKAEGPDNTFVINESPPPEGTASRCLYWKRDGDPLITEMGVAANYVSQSQIGCGPSAYRPRVAMSFGEDGTPVHEDLILWGCQVSETTAGYPYAGACLTGPLTAANIGIRQDRFCDARVLLPPAYHITRKSPDRTLAIIPGPGDYGLYIYTKQLADKGFIVPRKLTPSRELCSIIANVSLLVTSSLTAYIMAEVLGTPVWPFSYVDLGFLNRLRDYTEGTGREMPEHLDFTQSVRLNRMPSTPKPKFDIEYLLDTSPFPVANRKAIEAYYAV